MQTMFPALMINETKLYWDNGIEHNIPFWDKKIYHESFSL